MGTQGRRIALCRIGALAAGAALGPRTALAQSTKRLGVFHWDDRREFEKDYPGLFRHLAERGWREGSNLVLDWRRVRMDDPNLDAEAARLVASAPDAIFTESTRATRAVSVATRTIPIVTSVGDPVASGFAASLARPNGNITGLALAGGSENKAIDTLRELDPKLTHVAVVFPASVTSSRELAQPYVVAASRAGLKARVMLIEAHEAPNAMREARQWGARAAIIGGFLEHSTTRQVTEAAAIAKIPTLSANSQFGDLVAMTLEVSHLDGVRSLAAALDKVLRGARPGEIAFESPDGTNLILNRKILGSLGIAVPPALLLRASQVID